jgi:hypothetical protein
LNDCCKEKLDRHFANDYPENESKTYAFFEKFVIRTLKDMTAKERRSIGDVFRKERAKFKMDLLAESHALLYIKSVVIQKNENDLTYLNKVIKIDDNIKLLQVNYALENNGHIALKKERTNIALKKTAYGVEENALSDFSNLVLLQFASPKTFTIAKKNILQHFDELNAEEIKKVETAFEEQTKNAIRSGMLSME